MIIMRRGNVKAFILGFLLIAIVAFWHPINMAVEDALTLPPPEITARNNGRSDALQDLKQGKFRLYSFGLQPIRTDSNQHLVIGGRVVERESLGCVITAEKEAYALGYNEAMKKGLYPQEPRR